MSVCYQTDLGSAYPLMLGFPDSSAGEKSTCNARDPGSIPGSGRSTGEGIGHPIQNSKEATKNIIHEYIICIISEIKWNNNQLTKEEKEEKREAIA